MTRVYDYSTETLGDIKFRRPTSGPEYDLVCDFIEDSFPKPKHDQELFILIEPRLNLTAPDIVAIYWNKRIAKYFSSRQIILSKRDVRIMHYIYINGKVKREDLISIFGPRSKYSIERLISEKIIYERGDIYKVYKKMMVGAIDRLVTIEAKVKDWRGGIIQASSHVWLGSENYLLIGEPKDKGKITREAEAIGIGVIFKGEKLRQRTESSKDVTYGYWMLNEIILSIQRKDINDI